MSENVVCCSVLCLYCMLGLVTDIMTKNLHSYLLCLPGRRNKNLIQDKQNQPPKRVKTVQGHSVSYISVRKEMSTYELICRIHVNNQIAS